MFWFQYVGGESLNEIERCCFSIEHPGVCADDAGAAHLSCPVWKRVFYPELCKNLHKKFGVSTTEDLIRISLEGPSIDEFVPTPALESWMSSEHPRQPIYKSTWTADILCV